jgi:hypothetical protein
MECHLNNYYLKSSTSKLHFIHSSRICRKKLWPFSRKHFLNLEFLISILLAWYIVLFTNHFIKFIFFLTTFISKHSMVTFQWSLFNAQSSHPCIPGQHRDHNVLFEHLHHGLGYHGLASFHSIHLAIGLTAQSQSYTLPEAVTIKSRKLVQANEQ